MMSFNRQNLAEGVPNRMDDLAEGRKEEGIRADVRHPLIAATNDLYDANDVHRWEEGAAQYREFIASIPAEKRWCLANLNKGEIQAIFLGEKPALFCARTPTVVEHLRQELQHFGLCCSGYYIYKPESVQRVLALHPQQSEELRHSSADEFMQKLAAMPMGRFDRVRGLILGYPMTSIASFERQDALQIHAIAKRLYDLLPEGDKDKEFLLEEFYGNRKDKTGILRFFTDKLREKSADIGIQEADIPRLLEELRYVLGAKRININGFTWVDFEDSQESIVKQQRLQAAFQRSGILNES